MKIIFAGDCFIGGDLEQSSYKRNVLYKLFYEADLRIVNLEQAISDNNFVADKCTLYSNTESIANLKKNKIDVVNLANNHIQDKGLEGIKETIEILEKNNIKSFGAGSCLKEARKPILINKEIALLGYCEFGKKYLKQIQIADHNCPGVATILFDEIIKDIDLLPKNMKVIIYFHWGKENVWFPPFNDIKLARKLLKNKKVISIIGMHSHLPQGFISYKNKKAYMSLGNFLFPNFFIEPRIQLVSKNKIKEDKRYDTTYNYHKVFNTTKKKWSLKNRISIFVTLDTDTLKTNYFFALQLKKFPLVIKPNLFLRIFLNLMIILLNIIYKLPKFLYLPASFIENGAMDALKNLHYFFYLCKKGKLIKIFINIISQKILSH